MLKAEEVGKLFHFDQTETKHVEWKTAEDLKQEKYKGIIAKAIMALANTRDGGYLVIGIDENLPGDDRYQGVTDAQITQWKTDELADKMVNYMQPSVPFACDIVEQFDKKFVVVKVPEFEDQPVLARKDIIVKDKGSKHTSIAPDEAERNTQTIIKAGACYVRRRHKPASVPISTYEDMRDLLDLAAEKRAARLLQQAGRIGLDMHYRLQATDTDLFRDQRKDL